MQRYLFFVNITKNKGINNLSFVFLRFLSYLCENENRVGDVLVKLCKQSPPFNDMVCNLVH